MIQARSGYTLIILLVMLAVLEIGLLAAVPLWTTAVRRDQEEELIFRGLQYVEAIRLYQTKKPGAFPRSIDELVKGRFLRKPFKDPMTRDGLWDYILQAGPGGAAPPTRTPAAKGPAAAAPTRVLVVSAGSLSSIDNPRIIGVVSPSTRTSIRLYDDNETYDTWLFYYGYAPGAKPEIVRFGRAEK